MASYLERDTYGIYKKHKRQGPGPALMGADTLLGDDVVNGQDENLGDIKEIMIDMRSGHIAYAVLASGGFLGMGEKLFAVPWQALRLDTEHHRFVLDVPKERMQSAPGFDKDRWPDMTDVAWSEHIHEFYGTEPYSSHTGGVGMTGGLSPGMASSVGAGAGTLGAGHAGGSMGSTGGSMGSGTGSTGGSMGSGTGSSTGNSTGGSMGSGTGSTSGSMGSSTGSSTGSSKRGSGGGTGSAGGSGTSGSAGGDPMGSAAGGTRGTVGESALGSSGGVSGGATSSTGHGLGLGDDGRLEPGTGSITSSNYQEKQ